MTVHSFPALGFDPAPGNPDELERLAADWSRLGRELADDADRVRSLREGYVWTGAAARAFAATLADLPRDLDRAGDAYRQAGAAVGTFSAALLEGQAAARALEAEAYAQRRRTQDPTPGLPPAPSPADRAQDALVEVIARAWRLRRQVQQEASRCERALHAATTHAPHPPSWFSEAVGGLTDAAGEANAAVARFLGEHAAVISTVADVAAKVGSTLALTAALLAPLPVLGEAAGAVLVPLALVAGGVALVGHGALAAYAGGSWTPVVLDAMGLAAGVGPRVVERVAGRVIAARGLPALEDGPGLRAGLGALRHPVTAVRSGATAEMDFPMLVTRTVSYQFDLAGAALAIPDLAATGEIARQARQAQQEAARERAAVTRR